MTVQRSAVEACSTTTKMAASAGDLNWTSSEEKCQGCVTCFVAMIGCRPIRLRHRGMNVLYDQVRVRHDATGRSLQNICAGSQTQETQPRH